MATSETTKFLASIRPVMVVCPVARELYGVADPVVDVEATVARFAAAFEARVGRAPGPNEKALARRHFAAL